jgi:flavin reductase (DIM6/NTAB) family NADH-FMN oxidoreductase RutF
MTVACLCDTRVRDALARCGSGVTVVMAGGSDALFGLTATALATVSLAPPLVAVCIARTASAFDEIVSSRLFGVSILESQQGWIADRFARKDLDRFVGVRWSAGRTSGAPLIDDAIVVLECSRYARHDAGDHVVLLGLVLQIALLPGAPLLQDARGLGGFGSFFPDGSPRGDVTHAALGGTK